MIVTKNFFNTKYFVLFILCSLGLILTKQTGTDFLYYYLPTAEYLIDNLSFPAALSPSYMDGPMAFPPIEFIAIAFVYHFFGALGVKFYYVLKMLAFFLLFFELSKRSRNEVFLDLFLLIPTFLIFTTIFNTDLNVVIASLGIILYLLDEKKYVWVMTISVAYGLLSKYTFLPIYFSCLAYLILSKRNWKYFLLPLIGYIPFLVKNITYYHNPVFPLAYSLFPSANKYELAIVSWMGGTGIAYSSLITLFEALVLVGIFRLEWKQCPHWRINFFVAMLILGNLFLLILKSGADARFFLPFSLIILFYSSNSDINKRIILVVFFSLLFTLLFSSNDLIKYASVAAITYFFISIRYKKSTASIFLVVIYLIFISSKSYIKYDHNQKFDYSLYKSHYDVIEESVVSGKYIFTDYTILPYTLRNNSQVIIYYSLLNPNLETVLNGRFNGDIDFYVSNDNLRLLEKIRLAYPGQRIITY